MCVELRELNGNRAIRVYSLDGGNVMAGQNVLNGDLNVLKQVISDVSEYSANREELDRQNDTLKELNKNIESIQKNINDEIQIVCGMARGADRLGERYAKENGYKVIYLPADWDSDGKSAGFKRNIKMAEIADALVAFWDGKSTGTKHMIETAKSKGLDVRIKRYHLKSEGRL